MNSEVFLYLLPYLFSLVLSLGIFSYAWQHRQVRGARTYSWFIGAQTLSIFAFIIELISPSLEIKIIWDKLQWTVQSVYVIVSLLFALEFTEQKLKHPVLTWVFLFFFPAVFLSLIFTDNWHHLIYTAPRLIAGVPFTELDYAFGPVIYAYSIFIYLTTFYSGGLFIQKAFEQGGLRRVQLLIIVAGFLVPVVLSLFVFFGVNLTPQRDSTPFTFVLGNLIVTLGLFRYRLFDVAPIARERIVEDMIDPVIVLDTQHRVVDVNKSGLTFLGKQSAEVTGSNVGDVLSRWPFIVDMLRDPSPQHREVSIQNKGDTYFFDLSISPMRGTGNELLGHIIVIRDISRHKNLEMNYRALSEELEQRIHQRTEELRESAERYRAVVENQTELIARWKPDRTRTFVNEAYCRFYGLTHEQAMQVDFIQHVAPQDRPALLEKIARLVSGESDVETEIHRVLRPDGTIGWQEWTDHAIRDQNGQTIELQSIGRDITDQRKAEEQIRKLSRAVEQSNASIVITNLLGEIEYVNPYFTALTGYTFEEALRQNPRILKSGLTDEGVYEVLWKTIQSGSEWRGEFCNRKKNGELYWESASISPIVDGSGVVTHFVAVKTDITERKQMEEALRESESTYRRAIETAGAVPYRQSYSPDFDLHFDFIGEGIRELLGCEPDAFTTELWDSLVLESHLLDDLVKYGWEEAARRVRVGLSPYWRCEHRIRTLNGEIRWVFESAVELRNAEGISYGSIGLFQDITARKRSEDALRASEERFSKAFQSSPMIVVITQAKDARILEVNDAFEKIVGYQREEVLGKTTVELGLWGNPSDRNRIMPDFYATGEIRNEEIRFQTREGRPITCLISADMIELDGEQCVLANIQDISDRKLAEERVLRLNRLYATISQINQTIVHARDKESLYREICRVTIDHGQFCMAWVGLINPTDGMLQPLAFAGDELGYLKNITIDLHDEVTSRGPTGTAIREKRCIICQDIANDPRMAHWKELAIARGYRSSAAVPLRQHGQVIGALTVYANEVHGFDAEDEKLLEQIGQDVSFALDSIEAEHQRQIAETNLAAAYDTTLEGWARALELRDKETEGHSRRVTETTLIVARAMGVQEESLVHIRRGSLLHDIGKMGIPDEILRKNGSLTDEERNTVKKHPNIAFELLKDIPYLEKALEIPYSHHEKWDGSGYPRGLQADEIPLAARIFAIVDVWDALSSDRPYRTGWKADDVMDYLRSESGKHFDPKVVEVFLQLLQEGKI